MNTDVGEQIQQILINRPDLLHKKYVTETRPHPLSGHCYVASESYFHYFDGNYDFISVYRVRHDGMVHWFLKQEGRIIDLTADQFDTHVPYSSATKTGFLTKEPSKRAQQVLNEIQ